MSNNPYRTLLTEMAAELDWSQQLLDEAFHMGNRKATHPLADRARVLLDQHPEPESAADCLAARPTPQPPADGELTVNLRMDLSSECLKRLCDGLAAAVIPNGGYRELTTDDDISGEFIGEQQVSVTWWLPEHGCDSLENTLDAIKGRLCAAVRDLLPTAVTATPQPVPQPVPVSERLPGPEDVNEDGEVWIIEEGYSYALGNDTGDYGWAEHMIVLRSIGEFDAKNGRTWLPANALPTPEALDD